MTAGVRNLRRQIRPTNRPGRRVIARAMMVLIVLTLLAAWFWPGAETEAVRPVLVLVAGGWAWTGLVLERWRWSR